MAGGPGKIITPVKVGALVVVSVVTFAVFLQIVSRRGLKTEGSYQVWALFDDVLGLEKKSPVQIAGIDVGRIEIVELFEGKAKVTLEIDGDVALYDDARIEKVAVSLLGDYKLAIEPGGAPGSRKLEDGGQIKNVISLSGTDAIIAEVRTIAESMRELISGRPGEVAPLQRIVGDVEGSAKAARIVLEEVSKNIGANTDKLGNILTNVESFTKDLSQISAGRERDVSAIIEDARAIAQSLRRTSEGLEEMIAGEPGGEASESVKSLRATLDGVNRNLDQLSNILAKIEKGEGTVGALINDSKIHDEIAEAAEGVNELVGGVTRLQTWVNLRSEFQFRAGATKNYVQFSLFPKEDKAYIFEVVDDPRGVRETIISDVTTTSPETGRDFQYRERKTTTVEGLKFSLMFMKRYYWLGLRFGIIENTGGVGMDLHFLDDRLELYLDANQFGIEARNPRLKILAQFEVIPHVYAHGGLDDFLNAGTIDYFFGAGVRFNDEDLKTLLLSTGGLPSTGN